MDNLTAQRRNNRRLLARHACTLTVQYRSELGWHPATAMDLSRNGCRLRVGEHLRRAVGDSQGCGVDETRTARGDVRRQSDRLPGGPRHCRDR